MKYLWAKKNNTKQGRATTRDAAINRFHAVIPYIPVNLLKARVNVNLSRLFR